MASITISDLTWSTPHGRELFSGLNATFTKEQAGLVGRNGVGKTTLLKLITGALTPTSGAVSIDGALGVVQQTVQIESAETVADLFGVSATLGILRRAMAGVASEDELADVDWMLEEKIASTLSKVGLPTDPLTKLTTLSGGQRTRAALAGALFHAPDFLLLDEPTNNLDKAGRDLVIKLLQGWRGGAIVISHDRALLEGMDAIVELTTLGVNRYGGGWSAYRARKDVELAAAQHVLADAEADVKRARVRAQMSKERKDRRDHAGARNASHGGAPKILLGARKNRAEASGGDLSRQAERRLGVLQETAAAARENIEVLQPMAVSLPSTGLAPGRLVLRLDDVSVGFDAERPLVRGLSISIAGPEHVALIGANGSGKSTLLRAITGERPCLAGQVTVGVPMLMLDQTVGLLDAAQSIRDNFLRLNVGSTENACRAALASFQFRADAALQTVGSLSGGQMLRAGLACVLGGPQPPALLILDEPTNHLDIDSIRAVETGLAAYDGALLVVSHDEAFLAAINVTRAIDLDTHTTQQT